MSSFVNKDPSVILYRLLPCQAEAILYGGEKKYVKIEINVLNLKNKNEDLWTKITRRIM
jgi:hypothetical protein